MKRILFAIITVIVVLFSSCMNMDNFPTKTKDNSIRAKETLESLISHIQSENSNALKKLFAKKIQNEIQDFDQNVLDLINFYKGEMATIVDTGPVGVNIRKNNGTKEKELICVFTIETTKEKYHIVFKECVASAQENDLGIVSFSIINANNWHNEYRYRGDGEYAPGIHIEHNQGTVL